ncbi:MAG: hypothetical protein RQ731_07140 [Anaerosomatales bacterium]|nr:hypothetical protein [Anaerosomatales bacterium]MDT8434510.1 hypothetical protein [Anaerosomatales bacterium]
MTATPQMGVPAGSGEVRIPVQMPDGLEIGQSVAHAAYRLTGLD